MNLLKTSALNGVAVLIKTATMFILNKILAVYVGPAGLCRQLAVSKFYTNGHNFCRKCD